MPGNTNASQLGRDTLRLAYGGGSNARLWWAYQGTTASGDGTSAPVQLAMPWNGRVRNAYIFTTSDPGATIVGVHINRNLVALFTQTITPAAGGLISPLRLQGEFLAGQELSFSIDPVNNPGVSYLSVGVQYDSPGA